MTHKSKISALFFILLIYTIAITLPILLLYFWQVENVLLQVLIADILATVVVFAFSFLTKNSSVYDPYWSVIPPIIAMYLIWLHPEGNTSRQIIVFAIVLFWAVRLTTNWARGWSGFKHQDWRYTKLAQDTGRFYWLVSFLGIHLFPTILVYLGCLPLFYVLANSNSIYFMEVISILLCTGAVFLEWIADEQLRTFKQASQKLTYINTGLWSISRHPNYLGEILFWIGLFLFIPTSFLPPKFYFLGLGFVAMILLFRFISIPMMEKRNLKQKAGYASYIMEVPRLFPLKLNQKKQTFR